MASSAAVAQIPFRRVEIDAIAGDVKLVGDIDLDGTLDVVLGGMPAEGLNWFHYPTWHRTRIAVPATEFTTDGAIRDLDLDGDLDLAVPDGSSGNNLLWFENPAVRPNGSRGNPFDPGQWQRHEIGAVGSWCKDVEIDDFDGDGRFDVAARSRGALMLFFHEAGGSWTPVVVPSASLGSEGLTRGDLDHDGVPDLVTRGAWLRNPGGPAARLPSGWREHVIDTGGLVDGTFKALVADVDGDGRLDVLFSSSERTADVVWFGHAGDPTGAWTPHVIARGVNRAHTLQAADIDDDGDTDVVVGQMHTAAQPDINVHLNLDGAGGSWQAQLVDGTHGIHNGLLADIGADGDLEVVGSNWTGNPPLQFWENLTPRPRLRFDLPGLASGATNEFRVTNSAPTALVWVCVSLAGTTTPYAVSSLRTTFALRDPLLLAQARSGANGVAHYVLALPPGLAGIRVWLQAIANGQSSEPLATTLR